MELTDDAAFVEGLDLDDARLFSVYAISNAEREQERGATFTPGPCQAEYLARLQATEHSPTDALDGPIAAGIEDLSRAHAAQLRAKPKRRADNPRRSERRTERGKALRAGPSRHPEGHPRPSVDLPETDDKRSRMSLTAPERETVITFSDEDDTATVHTHQRRIITKLKNKRPSPRQPRSVSNKGLSEGDHRRPAYGA